MKLGTAGVWGEERTGGEGGESTEDAFGGVTVSTAKQYYEIQPGRAAKLMRVKNSSISTSRTLSVTVTEEYEIDYAYKGGEAL